MAQQAANLAINLVDSDLEHIATGFKYLPRLVKRESTAAKR